MGTMQRSTILIGLVVAACSNPASKGGEATQTVVIYDHFITCVSPDMDTWPIGAPTCPNGWREGGVCLLPNGQKEFVQDTKAAITACEKSGGHLKG